MPLARGRRHRAGRVGDRRGLQRTASHDPRNLLRPTFKFLVSLSEVETMTAIGQAAVLDLGARRDLSKRAVLKVHVVTNKGHGPNPSRKRRKELMT